jgi:hypothetical protein
LKGKKERGPLGFRTKINHYVNGRLAVSPTKLVGESMYSFSPVFFFLLYSKFDTPSNEEVSKSKERDKKKRREGLNGFTPSLCHESIGSNAIVLPCPWETSFCRVLSLS